MPDTASDEAPRIDDWVRDILRCPACHSPLEDSTGPGGAPELWCDGSRDMSCRRRYRIDDGIAVLLVDEARLPGGDNDSGRDGRTGT